MFPGVFRAKLNSHSDRRASVFATTVVALHPSFLSLYPILLAYAYFVKYVDRLKSEEWTCLACVSLGVGHALSFLATRWNTATRAFRTCRSVGPIQHVDCTYIALVQHEENREIVWLRKESTTRCCEESNEWSVFM